MHLKENEYAAAAAAANAAAAAKFILPRNKIWKSVEIHGGVNIHRRGKTERLFQKAVILSENLPSQFEK